jgi:uncharacterized membrane protein
VEALLTLALFGLVVWIARLQKRVTDLEARSFETLAPAKPISARVVARIVERAPALDPLPEAPLEEAAPSRVEAPVAALASEQDPKPEPEPEAPRESLASLFERFVGGNLLIWAGGFAMAIAGVFLVRYSIEIGLITPAVRMLIAGIFGIALVLAALFAARFPALAGDERIAQALAGAGLVVLYATIYGSIALYALIGDTLAFVLMAAVTVVALVLSLRHGAPIAIMGLAGGFLTPLLVGSKTDSVGPLLVYLGLLDIALFALAMRRGWWWLALSAVAASFVWSITIVALAPSESAVAAGLFVAILGAAASVALPANATHWRRYGPGALALVQLAILTARADIDARAWGLYALMAAAGAVLALRRPGLVLLPAASLALALFLLAAKGAADLGVNLIPVAVGIALIHVPVAVLGLRLSRDRAVLGCIGIGALVGPALVMWLVQPALLPDPAWALLIAGLAAASLLFLQSMRDVAPAVIRAASLAVAAAFVTAIDIAPLAETLKPALAAALFAALAEAARRGANTTWTAQWMLVAATVWMASLAGQLWETLADSLAGIPALVTMLPSPADALLVLGLPIPFLVAGWLRGRLLETRFSIATLTTAIVAAIALAYILGKQVIGLSSEADFLERGFLERTLITQALFAAAFAFARLDIPALDVRTKGRIALAILALATARFVWFDLLVLNPLIAAQGVGGLAVLNLLAPAYLGTAAWFWRERTRAAGHAADIRFSLFLAALIAGALLLVRQAFTGAILTGGFTGNSEFYAYSAAALLLAIGLLALGTKLGDQPLRVAGLGILTATVLKVFLIDAAALDGVLRILSFVGLGAALIGVGRLYARLLRA